MEKGDKEPLTLGDNQSSDIERTNNETNIKQCNCLRLHTVVQGFEAGSTVSRSTLTDCPGTLSTFSKPFLHG